MNRTDDELMADFQGGDEAAFNVLVERYYETVQGWAFRSTGRDWHRSQDLTQEVFLNLSSKKHLYTSGHFRAWLFKIARNVAVDASRKRRVELHSCPYGESGAEGEHGAASRDPNPADVAELREMADAAYRALPSLPDSQRETLLLAIDGESLPDIAAAYCVPLATAKSRSRIAREKLRTRLAGSIGR